MAGRGPAPKGTRSRQRDQKRSEAQITVVEDDGEIRGPELPENFEWPDQTREWWLTWRKSPQAQNFTDSDWSFLLDTAVLHAEFWMGVRQHAGELRLRVAKFGATPEDRARLRMQVGDGKRSAQSGKLQEKGPDSRRQRVLKAVGDDD
jgi:hypothetical protein